MTQKEKDIAIMNCGDNYDEILNIQYGEVGTDSRNEFDSEDEVLTPSVEAQVEITSNETPEMSTTVTHDIGYHLEENLAAAGLTQVQLAKRIGVGRSTISNIERGNPRVSFDTMLKAFHGLGHRLRFAVL